MPDEVLDLLTDPVLPDELSRKLAYTQGEIDKLEALADPDEDQTKRENFLKNTVRKDLIREGLRATKKGT